MKLNGPRRRLRSTGLAAVLALGLLGFSSSSVDVGRARAAGGAPAPLVAAGQPVNWWFVFKFNAEKGRQQ